MRRKTLFISLVLQICFFANAAGAGDSRAGWGQEWEKTLAATGEN